MQIVIIVYCLGDNGKNTDCACSDAPMPKCFKRLAESMETESIDTVDELYFVRLFANSFVSPLPLFLINY